MPVVVGVAVLVQVATATTFVVAAVVALRYGDRAQRAAENELIRQGGTADLLLRHHVRFAETAAESALPFGIAVGLAALAALNVVGVEAGRIATWIVHLVLLLAGGFVTATQVLADRYVERALSRAEDAVDLDPSAVTAAARDAFPRWLRPLVISRFVLVTAGSIAVLVLVSLPTASAHYG